MLPQSAFDADTVALMGRVCDEAWREVRATVLFPEPKQSDEFLRDMTARVMSAVASGDRDPARLKAIALNGLPAERS